MAKKIAAINCTILGGGGKVMLNVAALCRKYGFEYYTFSPYSNIENPEFNSYFVSKLEHRLNSYISQVVGYDNAIFKIGTKRLINRLKIINPDIIHIHGLHNWYVDYKMLFAYIKEKNIPVVWTQHDCWSFTGKCTHFTAANCNKWKTGCSKCPILNEYPKSLVDNTKYMYNLKNRIFNSLDDLTIVSVSKWIQSQVKMSFLKKYRSVVIENGVDIKRYSYTQSELRKKYNLENKFIILGIANNFSEKKGINDFLELSENMKNHDDYKIVLIGIPDSLMSKCKEHDILAIPRTQNIEEIVEWYSTANVFFNPSIEESFGLVTIEAMSCGTPVIVYNSTASPELVKDTRCYCVEPRNLNKVISCINEIQLNGREYYSEICIKKVHENYSEHSQYNKYIRIYEDILIK